jgi:hypothetical protein
VTGRVQGDRYPHVRKPGDDGRCGYCGQREGVCPGLTLTGGSSAETIKPASGKGDLPMDAPS